MTRGILLDNLLPKFFLVLFFPNDVTDILNIFFMKRKSRRANNGRILRLRRSLSMGFGFRFRYCCVWNGLWFRDCQSSIIRVVNMAVEGCILVSAGKNVRQRLREP
jgi:hypothetical protein